MHRLRLLVVAALTILAAGCIDSQAVIKVNRDGSGTIEQTMLVNLTAAKGFMNGLGSGQAEVRSSGPVMNEEDFKRAAERMGVRPVSLTPVKNGAFEGTKAVYAFDDLGQIRIHQDPRAPNHRAPRHWAIGTSRCRGSAAGPSKIPASSRATGR